MPKLPWQNSWFQLSIFAALFSAGVIAWDFSGSLKVPTMAFSHQNTPAPVSPSSPTTSDNTPAPEPAPQPAPTSSALPHDGSEWRNSLGMNFVPAGTSGVLVSACDTRVQDFLQFAQATNFDGTAGVYSLESNGWQQANRSWRSPGFSQGETSPVVAVSWYDAQTFCAWLTTREHQSGAIGSNQFYRLPSDAEWTAAAGSSTYPWGDAWPPAETAGNYLRQGDDLPNHSELTGTDGYAYTSPVGTFPSNNNGLFDMGGNVWEWIDDWYRRDMSSEQVRATVHTLDDDGGGQKYKCGRGASFTDSFNLALLTTTHDRVLPTLRRTNYGFRCVLVVGGQ